jgi:predicted alpha/beta-fold hydrolase
MTDKTVSFRVDKRVHSMMKMHDEINWSAIIRKTVSEKLKQLQVIDKKRAMNAAKKIEKIRNSGEFDRGESGTLIIRKWRDKRK